MPNVNKNFIKGLLGSRIFLFFIILILIVLIVSIGRESFRKYQLAKEINDLQSKINQLDVSNQSLSNLLKYFKEDSYLEKEARLKLNLRKPGEKVVILPSSETNLESAQGNLDNILSQNKNNPDNQESESANYWKWWEYLFGQ